MTASEHNRILVNYIRFKIGLAPIFERGVGIMIKKKPTGGQRRFDRDRIFLLQSQGFTWEDIAAEVGCSRCVVGRILKENENGISR